LPSVDDIIGRKGNRVGGSVVSSTNMMGVVVGKLVGTGSIMGDAIGRSVSGALVGNWTVGSGDICVGRDVGEGIGSPVINIGGRIGALDGEKVGRPVGPGATGDVVGTEVDIFSGRNVGALVGGERAGCCVIVTGGRIGALEGDKLGCFVRTEASGDFVGSDVFSSGELVGNLIGSDVGGESTGRSNGEKFGLFVGAGTC
jgi:hypothetical protein